MGRSKDSTKAFTSLAPLLGLGLLLAGLLLAMSALLRRIPDTFTNVYGYSPKTLTLFASGGGRPLPPPVSEGTFQNLFAGLWLALLAAWAAAMLLARRLKVDRNVHWLVAGMAVLFCLLLILAMPPALSTDYYNYLAYGRMVVYHGLNPYVSLPSDIAGDPIQQFRLWDITSHYGPVWIGLSTGIAWLAGRGGIFAGLLMFKGVAALSHLAVALLGYRLARSWGPPTALSTAIFLGWNPLLLLEGAGNAHNDLPMMALALAGVWAFQRRRPWLGYVLLLLSVMVKYITLLLLGFYLLAWLREQQGWPARLRRLGTAAAVGLLVFALAYTPYWRGPETILGGIAEESTHFLLSPAAFLRLPLQRLGQSLSMTEEQARQWSGGIINMVQRGALLLLLGWKAYRLWHSQQERSLGVLEAWASTALIYVCLLHNAVFPWYLLWPLATAGGGWQRPTLRRVAGWGSAFAALVVLLYAVPFV